MQMTKKILPILLLALVLMGGCRSHRRAARGPQPDTTSTTVVVPTPNQPSTNTNTRPSTPSRPVYKPHYYTSNFTCSAQGVSAAGQMRLQSDSVIWLCATKVVELGRAKFTPDSVIVYAKVMNRCFRGNYDDMYKRFRYRTTFTQLYRRVTADDAETQLTELFKRFGIESQLKMEPLKEVDKLTFPLVIPKRVGDL